MASTAERLGIVETKVVNLDEKIDDLKVDVKDMHDCLDRTRDDLTAKLDEMYQASCVQHAELAKKISAMEKLKDKWTYATMGGIVVVGWLSGHYEKILAVLK
jgi:phosphate starvation-inducible protein PhoH